MGNCNVTRLPGLWGTGLHPPRAKELGNLVMGRELYGTGMMLTQLFQPASNMRQATGAALGHRHAGAGRWKSWAQGTKHVSRREYGWPLTASATVGKDENWREAGKQKLRK